MSDLEELFLRAWRMRGGKRMQPVREYRFAPPRRWQFDMAFPPEKLAIEIDGGVWIRGRHNRPLGFLRDAEKYLMAARLGWQVLRIPGPLLDDPEMMVRLVRQILLKRRRQRWPGLRMELRHYHLRGGG